MASGSKCVVCSVDVVTTPDCPSSLDKARVSSTSSTEELLENELCVIYFLADFYFQDVLPSSSAYKSETLGALLKRHGSPSTWLRFCEECKGWVKDCRRLLARIATLQKSLQRTKDKVESKIVETCSRGEIDQCLDISLASVSELSELVSGTIARRNGGETKTGFIQQKKDTELDSSSAQPNKFLEVKLKEENDFWEYDDLFGIQNNEMGEPESALGFDHLQEMIIPDLAEDSNNPTITPRDGEDDDEWELSVGSADDDSDSDPDFTPSRANAKKDKTPRKTMDDKNVGDDDWDESSVHPGPRKTPIALRTCKVCNSVFNRPSVMKRHYQSRHAREIVQRCPHCDKGFIRADSLKTHLPVCKRNTQQTSKAPALKNNEITHRGNKKTPESLRTCPECKEIFEKPSVMKRHYQSRHAREIVQRCPHCDKGFIRVDSLRTHLPSCKGNTQPKSKAPAVNNNEITYRGKKKTPESLRTCPECKGIFEKPSVMKRHYQSVHAREIVEQCPDCGKGFIRRDSMKQHKFVCKKKMYEECSNEVVGNLKPKRKKQKVAIDTSSVIYFEEDDDENSRILKPRKSDSRKGGPNKTPESVRTCPVCNQVYRRPSVLIRHLRTDVHSREVLTINCAVCQSPFSTTIEYADHLMTHTGRDCITASDGTTLWKRKSDPTRRTCPHPGCDAVAFDKPSLLQKHLETKHGEGDKYKCSKCPKEFSYRQGLRDHEWLHLTNEEKATKTLSKSKSLEERTCPQCGDVFRSPSRMLTHLNVKHEKKAVAMCEVCGKSFTRKDCYVAHVKTHMDDEQLKSFFSGGSVEVPIGSEAAGAPISEACNSNQSKECSDPSQERPVESGSKGTVTLKLKRLPRVFPVFHTLCPICAKVYSSKAKLNAHIKTVHERSTSHFCEICGRSLSCKSTYSRHMEAHELEARFPGQKLFPCTLCNASFKYRKSLRRHNSFMHNPMTNMVRFPCPWPSCSKAYPFRSLLKQHQKSSRHLPAENAI